METDTTSSPSPRPISRRSATWIVAALVVVAAVLRGIGIGHQLPHKPEADAVIVSQAAWLERPADENANDNAYMASFYPYLLAYLLAALPGHSWPKTLPVDAPLERHLAAASEPYLRGRMLVACLSLLLIPATYRLARHFLDRGPACFAAALVATSQLLTFYGQQARPHAAAGALSAIAVLLALRHLRVGTTASLALASAAACLALGALHNGVFTFPALLLAWWFAPRRRTVGVVLPVLAAMLAIVAFYPFLLRASLVAQDQPDKLDLGGQTLTWEQISFDGLHQIAAGLLRFDPVLAVIALSGLVALIVHVVRRRREPTPLRRGTWRELCVAAAFPVCFVAFWSVMKIVWERFNIAILPFVATLAAGCAFAVWPRLAPRAPRSLSVAAAALVLAFPAYVCAHLVTLRARTDTQTLAARWLERTADPTRDVIGVPFLHSYPVWSTRASIEALPAWSRSPWELYQLMLPDTSTPPAGAHARWKFVPLYSRGVLADKVIDRDEAALLLEHAHCTIALAQPESPDQPVRSALRDVLREKSGEPVAAWLPRASGTVPGSSWIAQLLSQSLWGPPVEAYRLSDR